MFIDTRLSKSIRMERNARHFAPCVRERKACCFYKHQVPTALFYRSPTQSLEPRLLRQSQLMPADYCITAYLRLTRFGSESPGSSQPAKLPRNWLDSDAHFLSASPHRSNPAFRPHNLARLHNPSPPIHGRLLQRRVTSGWRNTPQSLHSSQARE